MLFNPGAGTLTSTTVEGAFHEACLLLQLEEEAAREIDPTIVNAVAINYFTGDKTVTIDIANLPVVAVNTADGVAYKGANYFNAVPAPIFDATGSDLLATDLFSAVTELAQMVETAELAQPEADNANVTTSSINTSTKLFALSTVMDVTIARSATGGTEFTPVAYLP